MMHALFIVISAGAAYWVFNDARRLGHPTGTALGWAIGTVFFVIVVLPLYLVFGRKPQAASRQGPPPTPIDIEAVPAEEVMHCPMCGSKVKEDFKVCPYCSHTLKPKCEGCGAELRRDWKTCPYCQASTKDK